MKYSRKIFISIFWVVLGAVLLYLQHSYTLDSYWSGLGSAFMVVGALQVFRQVKYRTNAQYREDVDTKNNDERNRFIGGKAWAWAGYLYVIIAAIAIIVLQIIGLKEISQIISYTLCTLLILYWVSYLFLRRKY
ncbi:MAG: hypothetical protein IJ339_01940 [Oscillospiraceae bacterium]|nr:hypothetical protein [Oscillospiraceae bacterium]